MNLTHYQLNLLSALETQLIRLSASLAPEAYAELKFLEKAGFVKIVPPDPNFSYLPDYNASDLFFALASPGWQAARPATVCFRQSFQASSPLLSLRLVIVYFPNANLSRYFCNFLAFGKDV